MSKPSKKQQLFSASKNAALTAVMAVLLIASKYVLQLVANVELVTVFIFVFVAVFGFARVLPAVLIFCALDMVLYTFSPDVAISYFIYWPLVCFVAYLLNGKKQRSEYANAACAALLTVSFGFLTTLFATIIFAKMPFWAMYLQGIVFYAIQIASSTIFVLLLFNPLTAALKKYIAKTSTKHSNL